MIVLDTHVLVWWVASRSKVSARARKAIDKDLNRAVCDITLWEIAKLESLHRLKLDRDLDVWLDQAVDAAGVRVIGIDSAIAARSTRIAANFHGDPADQLIVATAIELGATLVTADENLRASAAVKTIW